MSGATVWRQDRRLMLKALLPALFTHTKAF
nr:MAG TPA: hypothetical protein [Myoviridae sp. ctict13]